MELIMYRKSNRVFIIGLASSCLILAACSTQNVTSANKSTHMPSSDKLPAKYAEVSKQCLALDGLNLESVGDQPSQIVRAKMVVGEKVEKNQSIYFKKYGHSQGNPMPEEESYPDHCLVEGYTTPHIQFAMRLPLNENWNGRFMLAACEAWCGAVEEEVTVPGLYHGYATLTNNGGHYSRFPFDGVWANDDIRAREYFAHKANHVTAQVGKAITEAFYNKKPEYSYITGFSKGGNAGLMAVQRYPEDFDGVFVKAPVVNYNPKNAAHFPWVSKAVYPDGKTPVIYSDKVALIQASVLQVCDSLDGLADGVIDDPRKCQYDPQVLLCETGQSEADNECLNDIQVKAVRKLYAKPEKDGVVYFDYPTDLGSELDWPMAIIPIKGAGPTFSYTGAVTGLRYMATKTNFGKTFDWLDFDYHSKLDEIAEMSKILDPDAIDLSAFKERGGKVIIVHGWADAMISANMTIDWFEKVRGFMGADTVDTFAQLYIVPGMTHGSGGTGPYVYDAQTALVNWVEKGIIPSHLIMEDEPNTVPFRQRPSYPYPAYSKYKGAGDPNKITSFEKVPQ
ncbi:MAG: hypothetical protein COA69_03295 [Robiginitomaculum sp.]|nr:MAG: hypothetical protein COA69_03295 [Robiginitomaculum sp.]